MCEEHSSNWQGKPSTGKEPRTLDTLLRSLPTISVQGAVELHSVSVLGAFAKVRKATVSFVMSVCLSVRLCS